MAESKKQRIGIVGFGALGQFLAKEILQDDRVSKNFELAFVWNRSIKVVREATCPAIHEEFILEDLSQFASKNPDLIVEVCHPVVVEQWAAKFLQHADLFVGSPTAFANKKLEDEVRSIVSGPNAKHSVFIPSGAFWGADDIAKASSLDTVAKLTVTMKKHPSSLKLESPYKEKIESYIKDENANGEVVIYDGNVRNICPYAPNNVNTMACAALAAGHSAGGFDGVRAVLIADKSLQAHITEIELEGKSNPFTPKDEIFRVKTVRYNPAKPGAVTGSATYVSFLSSLTHAHHRRFQGIHFC